MVDIVDDPFDSIKSLNSVMTEYDRTIEKSRKDKNTIISIRPSIYYIQNLETYENATMYYTNMLNNDCTNDCNLEFSNQIRKKRLAYIGNLMKTLGNINFNWGIYEKRTCD